MWAQSLSTVLNSGSWWIAAYRTVQQAAGHCASVISRCSLEYQSISKSVMYAWNRSQFIQKTLCSSSCLKGPLHCFHTWSSVYSTNTAQSVKTFVRCLCGFGGAFCWVLEKYQGCLSFNLETSRHMYNGNVSQIGDVDFERNGHLPSLTKDAIELHFGIQCPLLWRLPTWWKSCTKFRTVPNTDFWASKPTSKLRRRLLCCKL